MKSNPKLIYFAFLFLILGIPEQSYAANSPSKFLESLSKTSAGDDKSLNFIVSRRSLVNVFKSNFTFDSSYFSLTNINLQNANFEINATQAIISSTVSFSKITSSPTKSSKPYIETNVFKPVIKVINFNRTPNLLASKINTNVVIVNNQITV